MRLIIGIQYYMINKSHEAVHAAWHIMLGPWLIGTKVSYWEHQILGVWGHEVQCKSPNLGPLEPECMVPCCTEYWCFGTMSDTIFTENQTIGTSMEQFILSDAVLQVSSMMHP